ncbi:MAG: type I restriction-modification system endonuclease, partial [Bradymonadaceae bacterium]
MDFASHDSNFAFLTEREPRLAELGREAEVLATLNPNTCIMQVRLIGELLAKRAAGQLGVYDTEGLSFFQTLQRLEDFREFGDNIQTVFHNIRQDANEVVHGEEYVDRDGVARHYLKLARKAAVWYQRTFFDPDFSPGPFERPPDYADRYEEILDERRDLRAKIEKTRETIEDVQTRARREEQRRAEAEELAEKLREERDVYEEVAREYEEQLAELRERVDELTDEEVAERTEQTRRQMASASDRVEFDEAETRGLIDAQLRQRGWEADSEDLRWGEGVRPEQGRARAIAEVPTGSGDADYVLFDGLTPVGVVEAKRWESDVAGEIEQAKRYSRDFEIDAQLESPGGPWQIGADTYTIPFVFAANGRGFLQQYRQKSGVWFQDLRRSENKKRPLAGWYTPDGLRRLLDRDEAAALRELEHEPFDYLGLRDYQREAVERVEQALRAGRRRALLAMATGTGKTRTAIGLVYRLVKSGFARRVLYLVDRRSLGRQAFEAFENVKLENQRPFTEIYDARRLDDPRVEIETRLSFATVQSMVRRVVDPDEGESLPPVDQFDCIVVDECHRGYNLDREMDDVEVEFRDHEDYVSKYRRVIDYFDAVRIGLTATPAQHTSEIFGEPVYMYRYQQAVMDDHLVDQDPPVKITTQLAEHGIEYEPGDQLRLLDPHTGEVDLAHAPDELEFDVSDFNRAIKVPGFNRAICRVLADRIDLDKPGKTLIFCVDEEHAQQVLSTLRYAYAERRGGVSDDAIKVITGYTDDEQAWLRRYKNEVNPKIAITVDYLTTGVDVPEIVNLVFLRRVKSRILYEQMKGRATRTCDEIHKDAYRVYDCVDVYDALEEVIDMSPVVADPKVSLEDNFDELMRLDEDRHLEKARRDFVGRLQRKFQRLSDEGRERFEQMAGMSPGEFAEAVRDREAADAAEWLAEERNLVEQIPELPVETRRVVYEPGDDEVIDVSQGTAHDEDYLEEFEQWVEAHLDQWETLKMVAERPRELSRDELIELREELAREGFQPENLREAWHQKTNQEVAASIMDF